MTYTISIFIPAAKRSDEHWKPIYKHLKYHQIRPKIRLLESKGWDRKLSIRIERSDDSPRRDPAMVLARRHRANDTPIQ